MAYVKIGNVSRLVSENNLHELFQCCGDLIQMKLVTGDTSVACIKFAEEHHADTAMMLDKTELGDTKLDVSRISASEGQKLLDSQDNATKTLSEYEQACQTMHDMMKGPSDAQEARNNEVKRTVYVGNLSKHCTPQMLRDEFSQIGEVVYIKFSGNADFRYAFIEFATEQQARMSFTFHGKVIAGQAIKIGTAHNPIFKDDVNDADNPLYIAKRAAKKLETRLAPKVGGRATSSSGGRRSRERRSRSNDRSRNRRRRRKRRRSRSKDRSDTDEDEEKPKMFWDGYQWHFNDTKTDDNLEEHVTSIIRSDVDAREPEVDTQQKMQNAAQEALKQLQMAKTFNRF